MSAELFVGIDLAWKAKARTGLAAVDKDGRLLESTAVVSDDEIADWIGGLGGSPVSIAVDAPLVVPNETGQRVGENLIARAYGRFGASPYPSNRGNPLFIPPRGQKLADHFGWSMDPAERGSVERPVCIEVYPHPAMVGLFQLSSVLPYKSGKGRTPEARRATFLKLLGHLETIEVLGVATLERWLELRETVETATRHMHLEAIEDELDAILCAHLAWLWHHQPESLVVFGSLEDGYIVAPPAPSHQPRRRETAAEPASAALVLQVLGQPGTLATMRGAVWKGAIEKATAEMPIFAPGDRLCLEVEYVVPARRSSADEWDLDNLLKPTIDGLWSVLGLRAGNHVRPQADDERIDRIVATKRRVVDAGDVLGARLTLTRYST